MRTSVTLQILLFAAGAAALAQSPGTFTPAVNPAYPDIGGGDQAIRRGPAVRPTKSQAETPAPQSCY
jgi:hypothetical protein